MHVTSLQVLLYGNTRPLTQNTQIHDTRNTKSEKVYYVHCEIKYINTC